MRFRDYTAKFYKSVLIKKPEVFMGSTENRIKQIPIIIQGTAGIGKTTLAENIMKVISNYYGRDKTNIVYTNEIPLAVLIEKAFGDPSKPQFDAKKPIQILVFDDATAVRLNLTDCRQFFSLRHLMYDKTQLPEGVLYPIFITHQWYSLDPKFRRNCLRICFLSLNTRDKYALGEYKRQIGKDGIEELQEIFQQAEKYDKYKGKGLVTIPGYPGVGYINWSPVNIKYWKFRHKYKPIPPDIDMENLEIFYHIRKGKQNKPSMREAIDFMDRRQAINRRASKNYYNKMKKKISEKK